MIPIGTHSLSISITGPVRPPNTEADTDPLVVIIPGAGDVAASYVAVERLLRPFTRTLLYDRSGLGKSEKGPERPNAVRAAKELYTLLQACRLNSSRLLLVGHSYGGIVAREFLHLHPGIVGGMVLVDAATERTSEFFSVPDSNIAAVMGELNYATVTGLRGDSVLSAEEWRSRAKEIYAGQEAARGEASVFVEVCETLKQKAQVQGQALGEKPLSVIRANSARDYERIYARGVEAGNGDEAQRGAFRELLDRWEGIDRELQEELLGLSSTTHFVRIVDCGHNVHLVRPDVIVEEVRWVRDRM
ncbi:Alpha/Beta hydrolase protein [Aspergillus cavernicola]|uniref:Alpha/Beta hydrolase protein n=1 Tax=Aspergillus cavernicola TaxID=176166 RepID=A0ABR4HBE6_9EURO